MERLPLTSFKKLLSITSYVLYDKLPVLRLAKFVIFIKADNTKILGIKITKNCFIVLVLIGLIIPISTGSIALVYSSSNDLGEVEITEYQGEDLSSIYSFRENSIKGPQFVDIETYKLIVGGLVENQTEFTYNEILNDFQSYKKVVTIYCVEGWDVTILWEGILIEDLLNITGIDPEATTVIFYAYDGYSTSLPLDYILENHIMIAYKMNNVTLPPERGYPFELVAESKWGYKWIKWITAIELSDNDEFRGFWEKYGYAIDGSLDEPYLQGTNPGIPEFPSWIILPLLLMGTLAVVELRKKLKNPIQTSHFFKNKTMISLLTVRNYLKRMRKADILKFFSCNPFPFF